VTRWLALALLVAIPASAVCPEVDPETKCWTCRAQACGVCWDEIVDTNGKPVAVSQFKVVLRDEIGALSGFAVPGDRTSAAFHAPDGPFTAQLFAHLANGKTIDADPTPLVPIDDAGDMNGDGTLTEDDFGPWLDAHARGCRPPAAP
jgi:hypothetical protein